MKLIILDDVNLGFSCYNIGYNEVEMAFCLMLQDIGNGSNMFRKKCADITENDEKLIRQKIFDEKLERYATDIIHSDNFQSLKQYIQHGNVSVYTHSLYVASCAILINQKFNVGCNERELIRGALLHDYFLYDWHENSIDNIHPHLHGFYHPGIALKNADRDFELTLSEKDIIKKHMWPLTIIPPKYKEAWVVTTADKYSSFLETVRIRKGTGKADLYYA